MSDRCVVCNVEVLHDLWCDDCWAERKASVLTKYKAESERVIEPAHDLSIKDSLGLELSVDPEERAKLIDESGKRSNDEENES